MMAFRPETVKAYGVIWVAWLNWLNMRSLRWDEVNADTILLYLNGPSPGIGHHPRPPLRPDRMAGFTRQRYWRVLRAVYTEAVQQGLLTSNPALDVPEYERPVLDKESRISGVLPTKVLALLRNADVITACLVCRRDSEWWVLRDRAAMLFLSHLGITTRELMGLRGRDLIFSSSLSARGGDVCGAVPSPALDSDRGCPKSLSVSRDSDVLPRTLDLNADSLAVLTPWLLERRHVLSERLMQRIGKDAAPCELEAACLSEPLFMSRQRSSEQIEADRVALGVTSLKTLGLLPSMEASNVYSLVKRAFDALYTRPELADSHPEKWGVRQASGPAIIRNSVILDWLNTLGIEATMLRSGLSTWDPVRFSRS